MHNKLASSCLVAAARLLPVAGYGADSDRSPATAHGKDSVKNNVKFVSEQ